MICVPTPFKDNLGAKEPDLKHVFDAVDAIAGVLKIGDMIILESTSPVGTTESIGKYLTDKGFEAGSVCIGYCPERVLPGKIVEEFVTNDRIIGSTSIANTQKIADFYGHFTDCQIHQTDSRTAEMCKLAENSFRDVNIAFANELSMLSDLEGINVQELIRLANRHPRVNILSPGTGVGGHCISVDPWFIVSKHPSLAKLIKAAREVNDSKPKWVVNDILNHAVALEKNTGRSPVLAIYGLSFKPDIDDLRESPALEVYQALIQTNYEVIGVEPNIAEQQGLHLVSFDEAILRGDLHIVLVSHTTFGADAAASKLRENNALDYCGCL